jgi:hypothetical protein
MQVRVEVAFWLSSSEVGVGSWEDGMRRKFALAQRMWGDGQTTRTSDSNGRIRTALSKLRPVHVPVRMFHFPFYYSFLSTFIAIVASCHLVILPTPFILQSQFGILFESQIP